MHLHFGAHKEGGLLEEILVNGLEGESMGRPAAAQKLSFQPMACLSLPPVSAQIEIGFWCVRAFCLPGAHPQLCKACSRPDNTDAHLMGAELVQSKGCERQERGREKHGKERKWRETT